MPSALAPHRKLLFPILPADFLSGGQSAAAQIGTDRAITVRDFERRLERESVRGLPRTAAEDLLRSWDVAYEFVPREEFPHYTTIKKSPDDGIGALVATTQALEKRWIFERFVIVTVFIDGDNKVSKVAFKALTAGP